MGSVAAGGLNNIGLQFGNTGQEFESKTLATIGQGAVVTGDALTGNNSLAGVNRDGLNTEIVIKDMQTGGLAVDTGIDTRVFTDAGRAEIIDEQKGLPENVKQTGKDIADAAALGYETGKEVYNAIQIAKEIDKLRDTLTSEEQVIFDNELKRLQVENSLESNIAPAIYGAEVAAAGAATAAGAACEASDCPEALINGAGNAKRALEVARMAQFALLGSVLGIFSSDESDKKGKAQASPVTAQVASTPPDPDDKDDKTEKARQKFNDEVNKIEDMTSYAGRQAEGPGALRKALEHYARTGNKIGKANPSDHIQKASDIINKVAKAEKRIKNSTLSKSEKDVLLQRLKRQRDDIEPALRRATNKRNELSK